MGKSKSAIDRLDEFGEDRVFGISIKTLVAISMTVAIAASGYTMMTNEIQLAKELPEPPVYSRTI
jgi:pyruvate/2-oxoglutarate/acetoin dehydrogenase E1 component